MLNAEIFKSVDASYKSAPFWSWNDELDENVLLQQIHDMHEQGMGGFFIHPRGGLKDVYLGGNFMKAVKACIKEAEKLGMKAWLYDEDRFPSGGAAGRVVKSNPEFGAKTLEMIQMSCSEVKNTQEIVKIYLYNVLKLEEDKLEDITSIPEEEIKKLQGDILIFKINYTDKQYLWDGQSYTDLCFKEAVDKFIEETHEEYKNEVGEYFGTVIPGIFTDEPALPGGADGKFMLAWSQNFQSEFIKQKGYDLLDNVLKLFYQKGNYKKVRFDYWDVMSQMFVNAFTKNIYEWCDKNNMKFTGHFWEHCFPNPKDTGSTMPNYEFMQYPGIDMLFNTEEECGQFGNVLIVKEVSSVANQLDKKRVISETYGASGWELDFNDQKRIADWQFALGINFVCQHLALYSLKGYRKRDFPQSFLAHQPWWDSYKLLGDYIGRLSYVMSQGNFVGDILVLHPYSSIWAEHDFNSDNAFIEQIGTSAKWINKTLCELKYGFDLGDDTIIQRHGRVEDSKFIIGEMTYNTIILPDMTVLRASNFDLLKEFAKNCGRILVIGTTPYMLDGEENKEVKNFFLSEQVVRIKNNKSELSAYLDKYENEKVELVEIGNKDISDIYCHVRKCDNKSIYFMCNIDKKEEYEVKLILKDAYRVEEWDAITGEIKSADVFSENGEIYVKLQFCPVASHLLMVDYSALTQTKTQLSHKVGIAESIPLKQWKVARKNYNSLTLKLCQYSINGSRWSELQDVLQTDSDVKHQMGLEWTGIFARQPWMYTKEVKDIKANVKARFCFNIAEKVDGDLFIALESPEQFAITVNGMPVVPSGDYHFDPAFVMYNVKEEVQVGNNEVIVTANEYNILTELESIYVVGDFKLNKSIKGFEVTKEDQQLPIGDWTQQGYPYYSGTMTYSADFDFVEKQNSKLRLSLGELWAVAARIYVNDREAAVLGWKPYEVDISPFINNGKNTIRVEIMNSLQNLLGPHNGIERKGIATPGSFFYGNGDVFFDASGFNGEGSINIEM